MKSIFKGLSAVALSAALLVAGGCGSDSATPQGQVVKGPVNGAIVTGANGATFKTGADGKFPLFGGPYTTTGGKYHDLATNTDKNAPAMKAPAGANNITALTTLVAGDPAVLARIESLGIKYDDALTTVTSGNRDAMALNESVGVALATLTSAGATPTEINSFLTRLATDVKNQPAPTGEVAPADIGALVTSAITATTFTAPNVATTVNTQVNATVTAVTTIPVGTTLTGATGSTGTTAN